MFSMLLDGIGLVARWAEKNSARMEQLAERKIEHQNKDKKQVQDEKWVTRYLNRMKGHQPQNETFYIHKIDMEPVAYGQPRACDKPE